MSTSRAAVDALLDERARVIAQRGATQGHLYRAEHLLHASGRLLRQLVADSPHNSVARTNLLDEIHEFLTESNRVHPGAAAGGGDRDAGNGTVAPPAVTEEAS